MMATKAGYDPVDASGIKWLYPKTAARVKELLPYYHNDLKFLGDPAVSSRIMAGIIKCVALGETKIQQQFGGYNPDSNEFGMVPLRPCHVDKTSTRWRWTSGGTSSVNWSAEDNFVASFNLASDEIILVYGLYNLEPTPNMTEIWVQPGSEKNPIITLEPMRVKKEPYFIFPKPWIIEPRSQLTIKAACKGISTVEEAGLLGYMFAPKSKLIQTERVVS